MIGGLCTKFISRLVEQHRERRRRDLRDERMRRMEIEREEGWRALYAHMAKTSGRVASDASRPAAFTAREAAAEADSLDIRARQADEGIRSALPSARPDRIDPERL